MKTIPRSDWKKTAWGDKTVYIVKCPGCGREYPLDHEVAADGTVTPSVECPTCPFHDNVRLGGHDA